MFQWKWWQLLLLSVVSAGLALAALIALACVLIYPDLPSLDALTDYNPKIPLRIYSNDGFLIAEFGEERRALVKIDAVPKPMKQAILAAEDERFYQHGGVDSLGVLRAALANLSSGGAKEGASTITMQVARNFFLSSEKTLRRKLNEALLAIKIEHSLSKDQILELYINQIYLGQRAYGFAAASQVYFGKPMEKLSIAETAMLAGLPKAPSRYNPFANLKRSQERQYYILRRMRDLHFISAKEYGSAMEQPLRLRHEQRVSDFSADYVAEIVRQDLFDRYQENIYKSGLKVYTTIRKADQIAAHAAVLQGLMEYDRRHGYRGPEKIIPLDKAGTQSQESYFNDVLDETDELAGLKPAIVLEASPKIVRAYCKGGNVAEIRGEGLQLVQKWLAGKSLKKQTLLPGALIRLQQDNAGNWQISQLPQAEAALVAVDPQTGGVRALVGGFDFNRNKFNHATQAWRQPGSSFKPFIYSAALEKGFTAASIIDDAPLLISAEETGSGEAWEPHNFDGKFEGPIRLRTALTKSKNMVSIRILQSIGVGYAQDYITRFGFSAKDHPPYLAMALGAGSVTPWQMAGAYSVFANGGYRISPYLISKIVDNKGNIIQQANPARVGSGAERVIDPRNAFIMTNLMQDVVRIGTAAKVRELGRSDLAGKTGTTNNQVDAWFAGFNPSQVAVVWMGFDHPRSLGGQETGGHAALPIWIQYMEKVLHGTPDKSYSAPDGVVSIKINLQTGARASDDEGGLYEYFYQETPPVEEGPEPFMGIVPDADAKAGDQPQPDLLF